VSKNDLRGKKGGYALKATKKLETWCSPCIQIRTLVKIRVETQAMCLAQFVLSCMNTLLDLSSSVSTSVLWKQTFNVILNYSVQSYQATYLKRWYKRERERERRHLWINIDVKLFIPLVHSVWSSPLFLPELWCSVSCCPGQLAPEIRTSTFTFVHNP